MPPADAPLRATLRASSRLHARTLFGSPHAYVQPHSGIDANLVAFWAVLSQRVESPALKRAEVRLKVAQYASPVNSR